MKIKEITKILETLPQDAQVEHLWYGAVRGLYDKSEGAPTSEEDCYWKPVQK